MFLFVKSWCLIVQNVKEYLTGWNVCACFMYPERQTHCLQLCHYVEQYPHTHINLFRLLFVYLQRIHNDHKSKLSLCVLYLGVLWPHPYSVVLLTGLIQALRLCFTTLFVWCWNINLGAPCIKCFVKTEHTDRSCVRIKWPLNCAAEEFLKTMSACLLATCTHTVINSLDRGLVWDKSLWYSVGYIKKYKN